MQNRLAGFDKSECWRLNDTLFVTLLNGVAYVWRPNDAHVSGIREDLTFRALAGIRLNGMEAVGCYREPAAFGRALGDALRPEKQYTQ